jgi:cytochrome c biogenesis protein CcmG/thiol:disulfide interchange protein DsbE
MKNRAFFYLLVLVLATMMILYFSRSPEGEGPIEVGRAAPQFQLDTLDGGQVSLSQYKGKVVLLDFWATWCGPCRMSMPLLERLQKEMPNDLVLLAINLEEPPDLVKSFVQQRNVQSKVLLDSEGKVSRVYNAASIPFQVLIDKNGVIRFIQAGFSSRMGEQLKSEVGKLL